VIAEELQLLVTTDHPCLLSDAERFLETAPESSSLEMAIDLVGEVDDTKIGELLNTLAIVCATHHDVVGPGFIAELNLSRFLLCERIQGVLYKLLHQVLGWPRRIHGREPFGADGKPALGLVVQGLRCYFTQFRIQGSAPRGLRANNVTAEHFYSLCISPRPRLA